MDHEDEFLDDVSDDMLIDVTEEMLLSGQLLGSCAACGTFLAPEEALSECPACHATVWPDGVVVRLASRLPQC